MNNKQTLHALQDKMSAELDTFRDWLLTRSPAEILEHTFEYTAKTDIVLLMDNVELSNKRLNALLSSPCPLEDVYKEFRDMDTSLTDTIQTCMEDRADTLLKLQRERVQGQPQGKKKSVLDKLHQKAPEPSKPHIPAKGDNAR